MNAPVKKLATVYYTDKPGGFCKRLYQLCNGVVAEGIELTFYTLDPESLRISEKIQRKKIPFPLTQRDGLLFWLLFSLWTPLFLLFELSKNPQRTFIFNPYYWLLLFPARLLQRTPHITCFYRSVGSRTYAANKAQIKALISTVLERLSYRFSDRVVTQTETMHRALSGGRSTEQFDWHLLPNDAPSVSHSPISIPEEPPFRCITVGMFDAAKNLPLLVQTFRELDPDAFHLTVVGDGPALQDAKALVTQHTLSHIEFTGWVSGTEQYYRTSHLLLHPSLNEGMPNAILEAFAHGLAVFGADTPELRELLGDSAYVFDPADHHSLLKLLNNYAENPDFRLACHKNSEKRRKELTFDWQKRAVNILLA